MAYTIKQLMLSGQEASGGHNLALVEVDAAADFAALPTFQDGSIGYIKGDPDALYVKNTTWLKINKSSVAEGRQIEIDGVSPYTLLMVFKLLQGHLATLNSLVEPELNQYFILDALPTTQAQLYEGKVVYNTADKTLSVCTVPGEQEVDTLTVTTGAASNAGDITVTLNGESVTVAVLKNDSAAVVAGKIKTAVDAVVEAETVAAWTVSVAGAVVTFVKDVVGACSAPSTSVGSTGVVGTWVRTNQGVTSVWDDINQYFILPALPTTEDQLFEGKIVYNTGDHSLKVCTTPGEQEVDTLTVTAGAGTTAGDITITLNSEATTVAVAKDDDEEAVAAKIKTAVEAAVAAGTIAAWTVAIDGAELVFTKGAVGTAEAPTAVDTGDTGCTFSAFARTNEGVASVWGVLINAG